MATVLGRYLARLLLVRTGVLLLGLASLMLLLEFLADGDQVIAASEGGGVVWPLARYTLLRLPDALVQLLPVSALLGGLLTLAELGRHSELTAIVAAGVSPVQLLRAALPVALLLGGLQLVIEDQALPASVRELRAWGVGDYNPTGGRTADIWLRDGRDIIRLKSASPTGESLTGVTIFHRDAEGNLAASTSAERATWDGIGWQLSTVIRSTVDGRAGTRDAQLPWATALTPKVLASVVAAPRENSFLELLDLIDREGLGSQPSYRYKVRLHERLASPATTIALILLTVALARPPYGRAQQGMLLVWGLVLGLVCWTFDGLALTFGELGLLPPVLAAWSPVALIMAIAFSLVVWGERQRRGRAGRWWSPSGVAR